MYNNNYNWYQPPATLPALCHSPSRAQRLLHVPARRAAALPVA